MQLAIRMLGVINSTEVIFFIGKNIGDDAHDRTRSWHNLTITIEELAITYEWALLPEAKQYISEYSYQFLVCAFF